MERMGYVAAIKRYFEQVDHITPQGGQKVTMKDITPLSPEERVELGTLAAKELGVEVG